MQGLAHGTQYLRARSEAPGEEGGRQALSISLLSPTLEGPSPMGRKGVWHPLVDHSTSILHPVRSMGAAADPQAKA